VPPNDVGSPVRYAGGAGDGACKIMPEVIARMERWADGLPIPCEIPISANEAYEVARNEDGKYGTANGYRLSNILDRIVDGKYLYRGHRVVVI
jgi:hypothetical protein